MKPEFLLMTDLIRSFHALLSRRGTASGGADSEEEEEHDEKRTGFSHFCVRPRLVAVIED